MKLQIGDPVVLRGIGPATVVTVKPLTVKLDGPAEAYRAGVGRGGTFRVADMQRVSR